MTQPGDPQGNPYALPPAPQAPPRPPDNPYAAPTARLDTGQPEPAGDLQYTGFWIRVLASIIDSILMLIVTSPLMFMIGFMARGGGGAGGLFEAILNWVLPVAITVALWVRYGATPGKMLFSAKIVDADTGGKPSTGQYIGRYLGYIPASIVFGLGLMWVGWDPRKQGWHDKMAGTVVVRPGSGDEPVVFPDA